MGTEPSYFFEAGVLPANLEESVNLVIAAQLSSDLTSLIRRQVDCDCVAIISCGSQADKVEEFADDYIISDHHKNPPRTVTLCFSEAELEEAINILLTYRVTDPKGAVQRNIFVFDDVIREDALHALVLDALAVE